MPRTDRDTWSITESVGATALMVAAARAAETHKPEPLAADPFAEPLVRAAGDGFWAKILDAGAVDPELAQLGTLMIDHMAVRTKFFDDLFAATAAEGVRQFVILASGLDSRAYRLSWPDGTTVYELDQPQVIEFKTNTLSSLGAQPAAKRVTVPIDLRQDWPNALISAGFDAAAPTTWLVEGLVAYLPAAAQDLLFERILALSGPGSHIGVNARVGGKYSTEGPFWEKARQRWAQYGLDMQLGDLIYQEDRADLETWLDERGWQVQSSTMEELLAHADRSAHANDDESSLRLCFIHATRER